MGRPTAWAAFAHTGKGWRLLLDTVRRTRIEARGAVLGNCPAGERTRLSDALNRGVRYKLAPVRITPLPYQTPADKRGARIAAAAKRAG